LRLESSDQRAKGEAMTVTIRVTVLAAAAAALNTIGSVSAGAQSFYDAITSVARTKVESKTHRPTGRPPVPERVANIEKTAPAKPAAKPKSAGTSGKKVPEAKATSWARTDILIAKARCNFLLSHAEAEVVHEQPIRKGPCGDPAPVKLISLGTKPRVVLDPPALLNCDMVKSLHDWLVKDLQPLARKHLKSPIVKVETMSSYSCRNAYGRKNTRLSQHARANAIDIRGFVTAKQARTRLVSHWGPTARDLKRAARLAAARAKKKREQLAAQQGKAADSATKPAGAGGPTGLGIRPSLMVDAGAVGLRGSSPAQSGGASGLGMAPSRLGGPALSALAADDFLETPSWPVYLVSEKVSPSRARTPRALFLRGAHRTACKLFGTVLGPEANNTHRNHFHVDLAQRRLGPYCK
jgi:hypothetical protein